MRELSFRESLPVAAVERIDQVCLAFEQACQSGGQARLEPYLADTEEPERAALFRELLILELRYRQKNGEQVTLEELRQRFPAAIEAVEAIFQALAPNSSPALLPETIQETSDAPAAPDPGRDTPSRRSVKRSARRHERMQNIERIQAEAEDRRKSRNPGS